MAPGYNMMGINPLGSFGLGMSGTYSDPMSMMGISPYSAMGSMGMMGMMGMMNPAFMGQIAEAQKQMQNIQQDVEKNQLNHAVDMHSLIQQAEVNNLESHERALFEKVARDGGIQNAVRNLADVIRSGDQDAVVEEYDKLKDTIYTKYSDFFVNHNGKINTFQTINDVISRLYGQIMTAQNGGQPVDLRDDIKRYGEQAFEHGFNQTFLGNSGHNERYTEETLNYLYGTRINDKGSKDRAERWGGYAARGAEGIAAIAAGFGAGLAGKATLSALAPKVSQKIGKLGTWGKLGAAALLAADVFWQISRD